MLVRIGLRVLVLVVRVRCLRSRRRARAEAQERRVQWGGREVRGQWERREQGLDMSENWELWAGMMVVLGLRGGGRVIFGFGGGGGGGCGCLVGDNGFLADVAKAG